MRVECVVFDMDGTITKPYLDFRKIREDIGAPDGCGILDYRKELVRKGREDEIQRFDEVLMRYEMDGVENAELNVGFMELHGVLREMKVKTGILTRNSSRSMNAILSKFGFSVDLAVAREDTKPKPLPDGLFHISEKLDVPLEEMLMVGDFLYDIQVGNNARVRTVLLTNGNEWASSVQPDFQIETLDKLIVIIQNLNRIR